MNFTEGQIKAKLAIYKGYMEDYVEEMKIAIEKGDKEKYNYYKGLYDGFKHAVGSFEMMITMAKREQ